MFNLKTKVTQYLAIALIVCTCISTTGCASFSSYMSLALQFAINGLSIYAAATQGSINQSLVSSLTSKEQNIVTLEQGFIKGTTPIADVQNAIADFQQNITAAFNLAGIKNPKTQSMIAAIVGTINSTISLAVAEFTGNQTQAPVVVATAKVVTFGQYKKSKVPSIRELKKQYNTIVSVDTGDVTTNNVAHNSTF